MYVNRFEQRTLASVLMDIARPHLLIEERTWLWVGIGSGELEGALQTLVGCCMRNDVDLPADILTALRVWLDGYAGTEIAAAFDPYIARRPPGSVAEGGTEPAQAACARKPMRQTPSRARTMLPARVIRESTQFQNDCATTETAQ